MAIIGRFQLVDSFLERVVLVGLHADRHSLLNQIASAIHRFGRDMPAPNIFFEWDIIVYAAEFFMLFFSPVKTRNFGRLFAWLAKSKYNRGRIQQLWLSFLSLYAMHAGIRNSKSHLKDEPYEDFKIPRSINSPSDESKVLIGPLQKEVDEATYQGEKTKDFFFKHTDPKDYAKILYDILGSNPVYETDFSSFEAHHWGAFAKIVVMWMLHMIRPLNLSSRHRLLVALMILGVNRTVFKDIRVSVDQRLMSGAMWTSSANSVLNLVIMSYISARVRFPHAPARMLPHLNSDFRGKFEGDDGICRDFGNPYPIIRGLGLDLKLERKKDFGHAKFCGNVCDIESVISGSPNIVCNPVKVLRNFFLLPSKYANARQTVQDSLIRARALSYYFNFRNCPVVGELCYRICQLTHNLSISDKTMAALESHKRNFVVQAVRDRVWQHTPQVPASSRKLVESRFGMSVGLQLEFENAIRVQGPVFFLPTHTLLSANDFEYALNHVHPAGTQYEVGPRQVPPLISQILRRGQRRGQSDPLVSLFDRTASLLNTPVLFDV